jgi:cytochrome c-type biogenesis protein CcmH
VILGNGPAPLWLAMALGAAWLTIAWTGLIAGRSSPARTASVRRASRLWAWLAVAGLTLGMAGQLELPDARGGLATFRELSLVDGLVVLAWLAALATAVRLGIRPVGDRIGGMGAILMAGGLAAGLIGFVATMAGSEHRRADLCLGQTAALDGWSAALRQLQPVAGPGFTARDAELAIGTKRRAAIVLRPLDREYFSGPGLSGEPARHVNWNGELAVGVSASSGGLECLGVELWWRPLVAWFRYGAVFAALGAGLLAAAAFVSLWWRRAARVRIGHRREVRGPHQTFTAARTGSPGKPLAIAAVLALGGYALSLLATPAAPEPPAFTGGPALLAARLAVNQGRPPTERWRVVADAMARHGQFGEAASVLRGAVAANPRSAMAWLAMGDALYAHAGGRLSRAAMLAYDRADAAAAAAGAEPPLLVGTAMERSGRTDLAAQWWQRQLARTPQAAPWRAGLEQRLARAASATKQTRVR